MKRFLPLLFILPLMFWVACEEEKDESNDNEIDKGWVITDEHRVLADENWDLETWVSNTLNTPLGNYDDVRIIGTHMIRLELTGSLAQQYGTIISSDSLENNAHWVYTGEVDVHRDSSFYENIGKYDQFVGGWTDCYSSSNIQQWFEVDTTYENGVSDIIIMTPKKQQYLTM